MNTNKKYIKIMDFCANHPEQEFICSEFKAYNEEYTKTYEHDEIQLHILLGLIKMA